MEQELNIKYDFFNFKFIFILFFFIIFLWGGFVCLGFILGTLYKTSKNSR